MRSETQRSYTPQFLQHLLNDEPPRLVDISQEQPFRNSNISRQHYTHDELMAPLKIQRNFGDIGAHVMSNSRYEVERGRIRHIEAQLAKCTNIQKQCTQYEAMIQNLKSRIKQLERKLIEYEETMRQMSMEKMAALRLHDVNRKVDRTPPKVSAEQENSIKQKAVVQTYKEIEEFFKSRIGQFIQSIKGERMTKKLEDIIENFLQELLQINRVNVKSTLSYEKNLGMSRSRQASNSPPKSPRNLIDSIRKLEYQQEKLKSDTRFNIVYQSTTKKSHIGQESSITKIQDMSVRDTSMYDHSNDLRDRSRSQRRRRIFD